MLAYLIDSSSAPAVVLMPLSSWGATIMGIMTPILAASTLMLTQLEAFVLSAVMNYYAISALFIGVVVGMYVSGGIIGDDWSVLANTDVSIALNVGGVASLVVAGYYCVRYTKGNTKFPSGTRPRGVLHGAKSMSGAVRILLFAWVLADLIGKLGAGEYLASVVVTLAMPAMWLVPALFVVAGLIAFATGTTWGSFGILLPLAGEMMTAVSGGDAFLIGAFGAVLAGAVWGDHSSPISDTTILSSTGAACSIPTHVSTQLPYAFVGALAALVGYVVYALTQSGVIGLVVTLGLVVAIGLVIRKVRSAVEDHAVTTVLDAQC